MMMLSTLHPQFLFDVPSSLLGANSLGPSHCVLTTESLSHEPEGQIIIRKDQSNPHAFQNM